MKYANEFQDLPDLDTDWSADADANDEGAKASKSTSRRRKSNESKSFEVLPKKSDVLDLIAALCLLLLCRIRQEDEKAEENEVDAAEEARKGVFQ